MLSTLKKLLVLLLCMIVIAPVSAQDDDADPIEVTALVETEPSPGDGPTSPLIWLHPDDLAQSLLIGSDDNTGLGVYDLDGTLLEYVDEYGGLGGADLRYGFVGQDTAVIAAAVNDEMQIVFFTIEPETRTLVSLGEIETGIRLQGACLYRSPLTEAFYVIGYSEFGQVEQYTLTEDDGEISATLARAIDVGGELEGCAVDDALRRLYFSEGENLVWRYGAEPEDGIQRRVVDFVGGNIDEEIEGVTVYATEGSGGYLLVSNESVDSVLLYERAGDNRFVGEFEIGASESIDSVSEPAGLAVSNLPLTEDFPEGLFVTTDDVNSNPNGNSNFKLISWADVAAGLDLEVDTVYDPRAGEIAAATDAVTVTADLETIPVPAATDAADDPAIWINPADVSQSLIIGTDKRNGLVTYNLDGTVQQTINIGRVNNVDLRDGFMLDGQSVALVTATNRTEGSLVIYAIDPETRELVDVSAQVVIPGVEEVYGVCMYISPVDDAMYAFVTSADTGEVEQYRLTEADGQVEAEQVRRFVIGSQTEGCVADDELETVYIGEEAAGFWKYDAEPDGGEAGTLVDTTGEDGHLTADVEGITLYLGEEGSGYLIVSSQGSSTFVVYERGSDNAYIGTFRVVETDTVDAVSGTDGLDVTSVAVSDAFPEGLLVVQDDLNINPQATQNFKLISWSSIAEALGLNPEG